MRRFVWAIVVAILHSPAALACSCVATDFDNGPARAHLMFKGEVLKSEVLPVDASPTWHGNPLTMRTTFGVKDVVRGSPREIQEVYSIAGMSSCSVDFPRMVGRTVTIAAYEEQGKFFTTFCAFVVFNAR